MMSCPAITVLMAVHNGEQFLRETLESVAAQTFSDFEFVILDDASTDASCAILAEAAAGDRRIRVIRNASNIGLTRSLNIGMQAARGSYIARIDADDVCLPNRLAVQYDFLETHADYAGVTSGFVMIDGAGRPLRKVAQALDDWQVRWLAGWNPPAPHPTYFFRRLGLDGSVNLYDEQFRTAQDFDLWSRLGEQGKTCVLPDVLVHYRRHEGSITKVKRREQALNCATIGRRNLARRLPADVAQQLEPLIAMFAYQSACDSQSIKAAIAGADALIDHDCTAASSQAASSKAAPSRAQQRWMKRMTAGLLADAVLSRAGGIGSVEAMARFAFGARSHLFWLAWAVMADPGAALKSLRAPRTG